MATAVDEGVFNARADISQVRDGFGSVAYQEGVGYQFGLYRPFLDDDGRRKVRLNTNRMVANGKGQQVRQKVDLEVNTAREKYDLQPLVTTNATTLRKFEWVELDRAVTMSTRQRLRAWADLRATNSVSGFDAMATTTYEYEAMNDPGEAVVDMDPIADGRSDAPLFKLFSVPLPVTHSDFWFSARRLAAMRRNNQVAGLAMAEAAGRRVAEMVEKTLIGVEAGISFGTNSTLHTGTSKVYGYTNFPYRVTKTDLTTPTGSNPEAVVQDIIEMRETMYSNGFYGPFMVYMSTGYDTWLDGDYFRTGGTSVTRTLRERIESIDGIGGVRRLDYLTSGYQIVMVQMTRDVVEAINGMDITTVQWESQGGARLNFRVMCIQVPLLKTQYSGVSGIVHGTTS